MNYIRVNTTTLRSAAQEMKNNAIDIEQKMREFAEKIQSLNSMWEGPAKTVYVSNVQKSRDEFSSICGQIKSVSAEMEMAASSYERCENNIENAIRNMKI